MVAKGKDKGVVVGVHVDVNVVDRRSREMNRWSKKLIQVVKTMHFHWGYHFKWKPQWDVSLPWMYTEPSYQWCSSQECSQNQELDVSDQSMTQHFHVRLCLFYLSHCFSSLFLLDSLAVLPRGEFHFHHASNFLHVIGRVTVLYGKCVLNLDLSLYRNL